MKTPRLVICMGVSGTGKSTCAQHLAAEFDLEWIEADEFHSPQNIRKMQAGQSLTDTDREPWINSLCEHLSDSFLARRDCVLSHSALRHQHRNRLRTIGFRTLFLHLDCQQDRIAQRLIHRRNHYMPPSLLESQLAALESATQAETDIVRIDVNADQSTVFAHLGTIVGCFLTKEKVNVARTSR